ncbi:MAG: SDR family oxidoreductase [Bacteroidota bacterium]
MKVLVIGATGRVGRNLVEYALEQGHEVTAFARNIEDFSIEDPKLTTVKGDVLFPMLLKAVIPGHDAVISVIGIRKYSGPITLLSQGVGNVIEAMEASGVKRLITITGAGILQESEYQLIMDSLSFPPNLQNISLDHRRVYEALQASNLDWTIACPAFMHAGERTKEYLVMADYYPKGAQNLISVQDAADFIVREIEENQFIKHRVGIAYPL